MFGVKVEISWKPTKVKYKSLKATHISGSARRQPCIVQHLCVS